MYYSQRGMRRDTEVGFLANPKLCIWQGIGPLPKTIYILASKAFLHILLTFRINPMQYK